MRNKKLWNVLLISVLAFALGLGTMALYTRTFTSNNNAVGTAKFKVSSNGTLDRDGKFEVLGDRLFPGADLDVHYFEIDKKDTEVPVKYTVSVTPIGDVFGVRAGYPSPLKLTVLRETENEWVDIGGLNNVEIIPDRQVENFKLHLEWPHNDDGDAYFEDLGGSIHINVVAQQIEQEAGEPDPGDPEPEPGEITIATITFREKQMPKLPIGSGKELRGILKAEFDNLPEDAQGYYVYYFDTEYNREFRHHAYLTSDGAIISPWALLGNNKEVDIELINREQEILKRFYKVQVPEP